MMLSEARTEKNRLSKSEWKAEKKIMAMEARQKVVSEWLQRNPEVGTLNSGKFYINLKGVGQVSHVTPENYGK